jgi:hypothetical protein
MSPIGPRFARCLATYLPTVPVLGPVGAAVVLPLGVMEPGGVVVEPDLALEVEDVEVLAVFVAEVTGLMVVEGGLTMAGAFVDALPGVALVPGGVGLVVDGPVEGLAGMVVGVVGAVPGPVA